MKITLSSKAIKLLSAMVAISATTSCVNQPVNPSADTASTGAGAVTKVLPIAKPVLDENGQPRKNLFISPYKPYNPIDTKGYKSGDVVGDPSTAGISKKTGKPVLSSSKGFRIP